MFCSRSAMGWALPETRLLQFDWLSAAQVWKTRVRYSIQIRLHCKQTFRIKITVLKLHQDREYEGNDKRLENQL